MHMCMCIFQSSEYEYHILHETYSLILHVYAVTYIHHVAANAADGALSVSHIHITVIHIKIYSCYFIT